MQHWDEFLELFVPPFRRKTAREWFEAAEALHMTFALVQTVEDLFSCPQLGSRNFLREIVTDRHASLTTTLLPFLTTSRDAGTGPRSVPSVGAHTSEVFSEWLGGTTSS